MSGAALHTPSLLIKSFHHPLPAIALLRPKTQKVRGGSCNIEYAAKVEGILNLKGYQHCNTGSKVTAVLLN